MALLFVVRNIVGSAPQGKPHIANAYRNARSLVATIDRDCGSARPRIEACIERFNIYKNAGDAASAGWMLAAVQERVGEHDVYGWRRLEQIVDSTVRQLLLSE